MIFITGDCHGDFRRFTEDIFPEQKELTRDDTVIVCGDFGLWHDTGDERERLDFLARRPFTLAFVDGNHENFDRLYSDEFPTVEFRGGRAQQLRENVFHLLRGQLYELEGKTFWTFGGARSHDIRDGILDPADYSSERSFRQAVKIWDRNGKMFRINHASWWEQELPSEEEMAFGLQTLEQHGNRVDYIVSHCCPQEVASLCGFRDPDKLTQYFNTVAHTVRFDRWYFGHYHDERQIMSKFILLYEKIERIV